MRVTTADRRPFQQRRGEAGIGLVESCIGLLVFSTLLIVGSQLLKIHVAHLVSAELKGRANAQAELLLNLYSSYRRSQLPDGGAFTVNIDGSIPRDTGGQITLDRNSCNSGYCDQVRAVPQADGTGLDLVTAPFGGAPGGGGSVVYTRAWASQTLDSTRGYRRITVMIFPGSFQGKGDPLAIRQTEVFQK